MEEIIASGIKREYLTEYFKAISENFSGNTHFHNHNWQIELKETKLQKVGVLELNKTEIIFRAEKQVLDKIVKEFRLKFLSAGG